MILVCAFITIDYGAVRFQLVGWQFSRD